MSVAAKSEVCALALQFYKDEIDQRQLDAGDLERIERALKRPASAPDTSRWGALQPEKTNINATCGMIDWVAETVAGFWKFRHIRSILTKPKCLFVNSQYVSHVLDDYRKAGCPDHYRIPDSGFMRKDSLYEFVQAEPGKRLVDMPHWEKIAFVLHRDSHWSILFYIRSINRLVHYDSLGKIHEGAMWDLCDFLYATGLVDRDVQPGIPDAQAQQNGGWQCGYAVMARLYEHGADSLANANEIIENKMLLFLSYLVMRNETAKKRQLLLRRWNRP